MDKKTLTFDELMDALSFTYKICEGVTVAQSPLVGFSMPPTVSYKVIETGEEFTGSTGNAKEDYALWKARQRLNKGTKRSLFGWNLPKQKAPRLTQEQPRQEDPVDTSHPFGFQPARQEDPMDTSQLSRQEEPMDTS